MLETLAEELHAPVDAVKHYCDNEGTSPEDIDKDHFTDSYVGHYDDGLEEYAYQMVRDTVVRSDWLSQHGYISYDKIVRDMKYEGWWEKDGHVFRPA